MSCRVAALVGASAIEERWNVNLTLSDKGGRSTDTDRRYISIGASSDCLDFAAPAHGNALKD